jgi:hypothetical protein
MDATNMILVFTLRKGIKSLGAVGLQKAHFSDRSNTKCVYRLRSGYAYEVSLSLLPAVE